MKRVLIVTGAWSPIVVADAHRARHLAWELPQFDWEPHILAPNATYHKREHYDKFASELFPVQTETHLVGNPGSPLLRLLQMRSLNWTALGPIYKKGAELIEQGAYDLVYLSTSRFNLFMLGYWWHVRFNIPYVLDYQDPWIRSDAGKRTTTGGVKRMISSVLAHPLEATTLGRASGVVSVSCGYLDELRTRYHGLRCLSAGRFAWIPFPGSVHDLRVCRPTESAPQSIVVSYYGAGGTIMERSFEIICSAMRSIAARDESLLKHVKVTLHGTDSGWKDGDERHLQGIAERYGLGSVVSEEPKWVPFSTVVSAIQSCSGLIILGVDDAGYVPSKLFMYALTGKPLLISARSDSPLCRLASAMPGIGHMITHGMPEHVSAKIVESYFTDVNNGVVRDREAEIRGYLAPESARLHAELFDRVLQDS